MKKALILGLLACLFFNTDGMHNKKLSPKSSKSSSGNLLQHSADSSNIRCESFEKDGKVVGYKYSNLSSTRFNMFIMIFETQDKASDAMNYEYKPSWECRRYQGDKFTVTKVEREGCIVKIFFIGELDLNGRIWYHVKTSCLHMPNSWRFGCEEEEQ